MINCPTCEKFNGHDCKMFGRQPGMAICPYAVERKPRNHFEMLKAMSMEEMAEEIVLLFCRFPLDYEKLLEWLKEEITDG